MRFLYDNEPLLNKINSDEKVTKPDAFRQKLASMVTAIIIAFCCLLLVMIILGKY